MTRAEFTVRLAAALRTLNLSHSIHDVMVSLARLEHARGYATIPAMCLDLACTYQAVMQQLLKNPHLFSRDETHKPARYTLTPEALELMAKVRARMEPETRTQPPADSAHTTLSSGTPAEPTAPTPAEVQAMREFLARVVRTPIAAIRFSGNPATDKNSDLLISIDEDGTLEKLDAIRAIAIDDALVANPARGVRLFSQFVGERANLYP